MRPIVQFSFLRLPGPGLLMWAQRSLGPTPLAAMTPGSTPDAGAVDAGLMPVAAVILLVLIVWIAVKLYDRSRKRATELDHRGAASPQGHPDGGRQRQTGQRRLDHQRVGDLRLERSGLFLPETTAIADAVDFPGDEGDGGLPERRPRDHDRIAVTRARLGRAA